MKHRIVTTLTLICGLALVACHGDHATTPTGGSLAQLQLGGPTAPVTSGTDFTIDVKARNIGFSVLHNTRVHVVLPPPLVASTAVITNGSGSFTVANGVNGGTVDFMLGTISQNSQSEATIHASGTLAVGTNNVKATVTAEMTSDEVHAGDAEAHIDIIIQQ